MSRYRFARKWVLTTTTILLIVALILTGCGENNTTKPQTKAGGTISVGLNQDLITLDPLLSNAYVDRQVMLNMYDTLVQVDQQNTVQPDLATSWTYTSPTRPVFTLRTGVKFQDGTPFNADAVVFNINRILSTPSSPRYSELTSVQSVQAIDASHVAFNLKAPFSPLLATLSDRAGMILSPTAIKKAGTNFANDPGGAGTGPFMFSNWVKGDHLTIKKNPYYWQKDAQGKALPYLDTITYRPITNGTQRFANLQTGTITVADSIDPTDIETAKTVPGLVYKQIPALSFYGIEINTKAAPFDNVHVRRAVEYGVNRQEILSNVLKGVGVVSNGPIPPSSWAYDKNFVPYTYNIDKAKEELALAGKPHGVSFTLLIASGSPLITQEAQFIQAELQPAGITVAIKQETAAIELSDAQAYNYQAAMFFWSGRPDPDGDIYTWFHTGGGLHNTQLTNPQVDALLDAARVSNDQKERTTDYQKAQQLILQDATWVFLYHGVAIQATSTKVQNFTLQPSAIINFARVYLQS
ncbi:MAG TPA: ABC transporter substrate-binding protein [Ktedonobacteraceae bacterium]